MKHLALVLLLFLLLCLGIVSQARAQDNKEGQPEVIVKFNYLSLFDPFSPSIQFACEYRLAKHIAIQPELGYISNVIKMGQSTYPGESQERFYGLRARMDFRYYPVDDYRGGGFYLGPDFLYKYVLTDSEMYITQLDGQFMQLTEYRKSRKTYAFHFKIGFQKVSHDGRISFDIYGGSGFRLSNSQYSESPVDAFREDQFFYFDGVPLPSVVAGCKIGVVIK